jgi:EAL and modified HD-GYP domain-containing signal transduction protein
MYIARQPIFNSLMNAHGYELLFSPEEARAEYSAASPVKSTALVLGGLFELGIDSIVNDTKAFIKFDYDFLMSNTIELVEPGKMVIEIMEGTFPDSMLIKRLQMLSSKGYEIALDDYRRGIGTKLLSDYSNIIKFDIKKNPIQSFKEEVKMLRDLKKTALAENVGTMEEFEEAKKIGFQLFQGEFFSKPSIVGGIKVKRLSNVVYHRILNEIRQDEPSFDKIAEIVAMDVGLTYRLLSLVSKRRVSDEEYLTIKSALVNMGLKELERWINVLMLQEMSKHKPKELMRLSLTRSKFGEILAANSRFRKSKQEVSLMCLLSVIDAMLDEPMEEALEGLHLGEDVWLALVKEEGDLMTIANIVREYESGNWQKADTILQDLRIHRDDVRHWYLNSCKWADETLSYI